MGHNTIRANVYVALNAARTNDAAGVASAGKALGNSIKSMKEPHHQNDTRAAGRGRGRRCAKVDAELPPYHQSAKDIIAEPPAPATWPWLKLELPAAPEALSALESVHRSHRRGTSEDRH